MSAIALLGAMAAAGPACAQPTADQAGVVAPDGPPTTGVGGVARPARPDAEAQAPAAPETAQAPRPQPAAAPAAQAEPTIDIDAYDVDGAKLLGQLEIEKAVYPYLGPKKTAGDVDKARGALEAAYRAHGYQSVLVEIPQQDGADGVVRLHVVEAPVGRFRVVGSKYHAPSAIARLTPSLQEGQVPDLNQAQKEVAQLGRFPGAQVTPILKPGKVPGTVDVDLKVSEDRPLSASVELNNDHAQNTTPLRLNASVSYDNLFQAGHTLAFTYIGSPQKWSDVRVLYGAYLAPIFNTPWSLQVSGYTSNSKSEVLAGTSVVGDGYQIGARGVLTLPSFGNNSQSLSLGADFKNFKQTFQIKDQTTGAITSQSLPIQYVPVTAAYSFQHFGGRSTAIASASLTAGIRGLGSDLPDFQNNRADASQNFVHANLSLDYTRVIGHGFNAQARLAGQLADQPLLTNEQFAIGGYGTVRGFLQTETLGDDGVFGSLELRSPSFAPRLGAWVDEMRLYAFVDGGQIWVLGALPEQDARVALASTGLGLRVDLLKHLKGDVLVALPLNDGPTSDAGDPRVTFSVKTEF